MNEDGTMSRLPELTEFSREHNLKMITIKDLIAYRMRTEHLVEEVLTVKFPTAYGDFDLHLFKDNVSGDHNIALKIGNIKADEPCLVRVHSSCLTGDVLGSMRCDCGSQLHEALRRVAEAGSGVVLYMMQEGRGIGLVNKLKAYALQDEGYDTVEANEHLGFPADLRDYGIGAQILVALGVHKMKLLTNNPRKLIGLEGYGLEIVERSPIEVGINKKNIKYLSTKKEKLGHLLSSI
jgi:3,4-dihydroxy 2-butanone 4-phosphate synthase/GTP cyclohydrolase II